jgi:hypothetical protein
MSGIPSPGQEPRPQTDVIEIARWVLGISGAGIFLVAGVTLIAAHRANKLDTASTMVFNALLPLFGTWVGTVLAYYFSRKNFESASQSMERIVNLTVDQKLQQLTVSKEMIPLNQITLYTIPAGKKPADVTIKDIQAKLGGKITRVPIVDDKGIVMYIVHQSGLYRFLAEQAIAGKPLPALTLQNLVDDATLKDWVTNIVYVSEQASVAAAKAAMEARSGCQDLVVTKTGANTEPMLGWMTNVDIGRLSKA